MRPTLVFIRAHYIDGKLAHWPGEEVPPGTFNEETIGRALDEGFLAEYAERRSLYRLLRSFSGCEEQDQLTNEQEKRDLCL